MGYADAIIQGNRGTAQANIQALSQAGVHITCTLQEIVELIKHIRGDNK